jgi:hypothetical protein
VTTDGLGGEHAAERRRQLAALRPGQPCPRCGGPMYPGQALDLDHMVPRSLGGDLGPVALSHARCNRAHGAALGNRLRGVPGRPVPPRPAPRRQRYPDRWCVICGARYQPSRADQRACGRACGWALRRRNAAAGRPAPAMVTVTPPARPWRSSRDW